jgi:hypothetical protein
MVNEDCKDVLGTPKVAFLKKYLFWWDGELQYILYICLSQPQVAMPMHVGQAF